jgi:hypothetical protein
MKRLLFLLSLILLLGGSACHPQPDYASMLAQMRTEIETLEVLNDQLEQDNSRLRELIGANLPVAFEVQVGAFAHFDLSPYLSNLIRMAQVQESAYNRYILGRFRRYETAMAFMQEIRRMGVKDAFITGTIDGQRVTITEAKVAAEQLYGDEPYGEVGGLTTLTDASGSQ